MAAASIEIFVDADACPVKDEIYRVASRYGVPVAVVANARLFVPPGVGAELVLVPEGPDAADDWIAGAVRAGDVVVTADVPLAARCLAAGARVLGSNGRPFDEDSIGDALATRDLKAGLRGAGLVTGGPPPLSERDRSRFLSKLDELVARGLRERRAGADAAADGSLAEPLEANAATAWRIAPGLCAREPSGQSCAWYHGVYPTLRLLGLAAAPERHARFFSDALQRAALAGCERVLVSGAADTAMLAQVLAAYAARAGARPRVQVLDRCETPLQLCRDYAGRVGREIETRRLDLLDAQARRPAAAAFDLICTHSLLAMFPLEARRSAIAAWRAALRRGGKLVSSVRIDPQAAPQSAGDPPERARAFRELVLSRASGWRGTLAAPPEQIADAALRYAARLHGWPVASADELATLLLQGGFAIEQLDVVDVAGALPATSASPGSARPATYAEFVARRL